jgi:hypothetical protein
LAIAGDGDPIYQDVPDARGRVGDQPLTASGKVSYPAQRPRSDRRWIEHDDVCMPAWKQIPAAGKSQEVGLFAGQLADRVLQRQCSPVAYPASQ